MNTKIFDNQSWLGKVIEGVSKSVRAAAPTLGPKGKLVLWKNRASKDGKTVVEAIRKFKDPLHQVGLDYAMNVSSEVASQAGDSTTSSLILFEAILKKGAKCVLAGEDASQVVQGIEAALKYTTEFLCSEGEKVSKDDPRLEHLATTSANKDSEIGKQVAEIIARVGDEGFVNIESTNSLETSYTFAEGAKINSGYKSSCFITNPEKGLCEMDNPMIVLCDKTLGSYEDAASFMEHIIPALGSKPVVIICEKCEGFFIKWLASGNVQQVFKVCAIEIPGYGDKTDAISDIEAITGATLISSTRGIEFKNFDPGFFGTAKKVICDSKTTSIIVSENNIAKVKSRGEEIKRIIEMSDTMPEYKINALRQRLNAITGLACTYRVGGANDIARKERRDRIDDALGATQSALSSGILPGGGASLIRAQQKLEEVIKNEKGRPEAFLMGMKSLQKALSAPLEQNLENAGVEYPDVIIDEVRKAGKSKMGYDIESGKICNMIEAGIIDSQKSQCTALRAAATYAIMLLSSAVLLIEEEEDSQATQSYK